MSSSRGIPGHTPTTRALALRTRHLGRQDYEQVWTAMVQYTQRRDADSVDEIWLLEHPPVFTLGQGADPRHVLAPGDIPVVRTDRGGQVTYHGPGQLIVYVLVDLRRAGLPVKAFVRLLEQVVIDTVSAAGVTAGRRAGAPGVYVHGEKLAALGVRVRKGCSYHGLAVNVNMDLAPFARINPCGYPGLGVTQLSALAVDWTLEQAGERFAETLRQALDAVGGPGSR